MNRRGFLKNAAGLGGAAFIVPTLSTLTTKAFAERKKAGTGPEMVSTNDPLAKSVLYVEDGTKNPNSKGNKCSTCILYVKKDTKNGKEIGTCSIFQNKNVYADGFCNSWAKKS